MTALPVANTFSDLQRSEKHYSLHLLKRLSTGQKQSKQMDAEKTHDSQDNDGRKRYERMTAANEMVRRRFAQAVSLQRV